MNSYKFNVIEAVIPSNTTGNGKTHYVMSRTSEDQLMVISLNESFNPADIVPKIREFLKSKKCTLFFNFTFSLPQVNET